MQKWRFPYKIRTENAIWVIYSFERSIKAALRKYRANRRRICVVHP